MKLLKAIAKAFWILFLLYVAAGLLMMIAFETFIGGIPMNGQAIAMIFLWPVFVVVAIIFIVASFGAPYS